MGSSVEASYLEASYLEASYWATLHDDSIPPRHVKKPEFPKLRLVKQTLHPFPSTLLSSHSFGNVGNDPLSRATFCDCARDGHLPVHTHSSGLPFES